MPINTLKKSLALVVSAAAVLALAGCGTTDGSGTAATGAGSSASATGFDASSIKKDPALAAMLPKSVTKDGKLVVGANLSYAPAEFVAADGKTAQGYDVDLTKALAALFGLQPEVLPSTFDSIIPAVGSKYDLGISAFTVTADRLKSVNMVTYAQAGMSYAVKAGNPKKIDTATLCGVRVAVETGTVEEQAANDAVATCKKIDQSSPQVQSYAEQTSAATAVVTGKADIFYADSPVTGYAIKQTNGQLESIGPTADAAPQGIVVAKGDTQTVKAVAAALRKLMADGVYKKIFAAWGVQSAMVDAPKVNSPSL